MVRDLHQAEGQITVAQTSAFPKQDMCERYI
jgi:hypothetical protein